MTNPSPKRARTVESNVYDREYFLTNCDGYDEFVHESGYMPKRLLEAINRVEITNSTRILDIGCGRGEIVQAGLEKGAKAYGVDYAFAAIEIARDNLRAHGVAERVGVFPANAKCLPFVDASFDVLFMLDVVEHLYPDELDQALREAYRILDRDGMLLVHTAPNIWYYRYGYPAYRLLRKLQGQSLPRDPKDRFAYHHAAHVNEQSAMSLKRVLTRAGFATQVWVDQSQDRLSPTDSKWVRWMAKFTTHAIGLKYIFCGDVYAIARKKMRD